MAIALLFLLGVGAGLALLISLTNLRTRVRELAGEIERLKKRTAAIEERAKSQAVAWSDAPPPPRDRAAPAQVLEAVPLPAQPLREAPPPPAPPAPPSRSKEEWEALIGGKVLNRIGALALIIGIGYFLKFAFDRNWITETFRVLIGAAVGFSCLLIAARTHRKGFQIFAQGLVGAGIAILYLSVYASFNFYSLVSQGIAFLLMSIVTVIAFLQAFRYNAPAVSVLGLIGGFLTPFLLATGKSNLVGLFTYITLLDVGILLVVWKREAWMGLEPLAILGTYAVFASWRSVYYTGADLLPATIFLSIFWLMFHLLDLSHLRTGSGRWAQERRVLAVLHGVVYYALLAGIFYTETPEWRAFATLLLGTAYGASALACAGEEKRKTDAVTHFTLGAVVLLVLATEIECSDFALPVAWSLESIAVVWFGFRRRRTYLWGSGLILMCLAWLTLIFTPGALFCETPETFVPLLNVRALAFVLVIASVLAASLLFRTGADARRGRIGEVLHYAWGLLLVILVTVEINDWFRSLGTGSQGNIFLHIAYLRILSIATAWVVIATLLTVAGLRWRIRPLVYLPLWVLLAGAMMGCTAGFTYQPIEFLIPVANARAGALLMAFAGTSLHLFWFRRTIGVFPALRYAVTSLQVLATVLPLFFLSVETRDIFQQQIAALDGAVTLDYPGGELERLENLKQLSLSGLWLVYSIGLMTIGLWRRKRLIRLEAIGLFGVAILKIFIYDLSFLETLYRIFSFVGLGLILLLVSYLYQRYKSIILGPSKRE